MYTRSIPVFTHFLTALGQVLAKADAHCTQNGIAPEALLEFRLFPDMFPLRRQVQLTCDFATRGADRLAGVEVSSFPDTETGFADLQARIAAARAHLATFSEDQFEGAGERLITITLRTGEMTMDGERFLTSYAMPQFHFHATTAYNILRHNGVVLGKRDYMGVA
ncbi:MAG: DUF1993 domain-containing protein [Rhodobacteraceae bacterium]|nr:DUF1993 domain-containing protein [Paracoccaceae bacterium]